MTRDAGSLATQLPTHFALKLFKLTSVKTKFNKKTSSLPPPPPHTLSKKAVWPSG